jgi:hypothetical protein
MLRLFLFALTVPMQCLFGGTFCNGVVAAQTQKSFRRVRPNLVVIGSAGLGWTLVGRVQQRLKVGVSGEREKG